VEEVEEVEKWKSKWTSGQVEEVEKYNRAIRAIGCESFDTADSIACEQRAAIRST